MSPDPLASRAADYDSVDMMEASRQAIEYNSAGSAVIFAAREVRKHGPNGKRWDDLVAAVDAFDALDPLYLAPDLPR